jgi:DNA-binding NarL/FixJ family response regulator
MARTVFIVEDAPEMREAYAMLLELEGDFESVGTAADAGAAYEALADASPDLALVDVSLPGEDGLSLTRRLTERAPDLRILVVSGHSDVSYVQEAVDAGARGYVLKSEIGECLGEAASAVLEGGRYFSPSVPRPTRT